jgi:ornithine cyclodeaminase/alanine dehydrogenase-like protein (mu-crystallin family)
MHDGWSPKVAAPGTGMDGTLILTRSETERLLDSAALLALLRRGFVAYSTDRSIPARRVRSDLPGAGAAMLLFPGLIPGIPAYSVKVHAKFPAERPAIRGVVHLHDLASGRLLALMDSTHLTALRTGLAGALAADALARADAERVAIVGAGAQGELQARCLPLVRRVRHISVYDSAVGQAAAFAARMGRELSIDVEPATSLERAVADAEIIVTATWARAPFLFDGMVRPGAHITTLGPDEPGKCEVDAALLRRALVVCDDRDLAVSMGAVGGAGLGVEAIAAELGEVLAGAHPGRVRADAITVFGGVGLAFQDLAAAWCVYEAARERGAGQSLDLLS